MEINSGEIIVCLVKKAYLEKMYCLLKDTLIIRTYYVLSHTMLSLELNCWPTPTIVIRTSFEWCLLLIALTFVVLPILSRASFIYELKPSLM